MSLSWFLTEVFQYCHYAEFGDRFAGESYRHQPVALVNLAHPAIPSSTYAVQPEMTTHNHK